MFKTSTLAFFYTETSMHAGSGEPFEAVDRAIQRERHTGWPVVWQSGIKGSARDWFTRHPGTDEHQVTALFGPDTDHAHKHAGAVSFTDARTLLFPVRSACGTFCWTTCPTALARLVRDLATAGSVDAPPLPTAVNERAVTTERGRNQLGRDGDILLEEFAYPLDADEAVGGWARWLGTHAFPDSDEYAFFRDRLASHLVVLPDDAFTDFVRYATEIQARVKLGEGKSTDTGEGGNLFYQENLPSDALLYSGLHVADDLSGRWPNGGRAADLSTHIRDALGGRRIQIGGDEFVGKGVCMTRFL